MSIKFYSSSLEQSIESKIKRVWDEIKYAAAEIQKRIWSTPEKRG